MVKLIDEFRRGWEGTSEPSPLFSIGFAGCCLALATAARWGLSLIRPDVFFIPYFPAVFFAAAFGGYRLGIATAIIGGALGVTVNFSDAPTDFAKLVLLAIYLVVCGLTIWGVEHYRSVAARQRQISGRLLQEEKYRKLVVEEFQHRLKNKLSTIHAVIHLVLQDQPQIWASIDQRLRALSAADDLVARVDGSGCDIKDLLISELGPYGHVRFTLNGSPLFLPAKLAVSLALVFHELATNAAKYGAFSSLRGLLQVSWSVSDDRLNVTCFGTRLLKSALTAFDGKIEVAFLRTGVHCTMQCRIPPE
jgi:HWE histidine kinase